MLKFIKKYSSLPFCTLVLTIALLVPTHIVATQEISTDKKTECATENSDQTTEQNNAQSAEQSAEQKPKKPTMAESWRKVVTLRWKEIHKADAWNIGKSFAGVAILSLLYSYWPKGDAKNNDHADDNKPATPPHVPTGGNNDSNYNNSDDITPIKNVNKDFPKDIQNNIALHMAGEFLVTPKTLDEDDRQQYLPAVHNNKIANIVNGNIHIWDVNTGELLHTFQKPDSALRSEYTVKIYDNNVVIAADGVWQNDKLHILDITTGTYKSWNPLDYDGLIAIDDEKIVIPFYKQQEKLLSINVYNVHTGNLLYTRSCGKISSDSWYAMRACNQIAINKNKLICVFFPLTITIYNINRGNMLYSIKELSDRHDISKDRHGLPKTCITSIATANDKLVIGFSDHVAEICNIETGDLLHTLRGHTGEIYSVSIEDNQVTTASRDHTIKIWDINSGKLLQTFAGLINFKGHLDRCIKVGDKIVAKSFPGALKIWPLYIDLNNFVSNDNPWTWIKHNITIPQAELINRAQCTTFAKKDFIIALPDHFNKIGESESQEQYDGRTYFSMPEHVREYLRTRLNIRK